MSVSPPGEQSPTSRPSRSTTRYFPLYCFQISLFSFAASGNVVRMSAATIVSDRCVLIVFPLLRVVQLHLSFAFSFQRLIDLLRHIRSRNQLWMNGSL